MLDGSLRRASLKTHAATADEVEVNASTSNAALRQLGISVSDLIDAGLLHGGERLEWVRPALGEHHSATLTDAGEVLIDGSGAFPSPSTAASAVTEGSFNGWKVWTVPRLGGVPLADVRELLIAHLSREQV